MNNKVVVGIGEILWDVFPGRKVLGGAPANFAYHAAQWGLDGVAVSAVGKDESGREILCCLKDKISGCLIEEVDYPTGTVQVTLNEKGVPQYEICEGVAWDYIPFTEEMKRLASRTDTVCFGSLAQCNPVSNETIMQFLSAMPESSLKIFDINLRQHYYTEELICRSLTICDILKINEDEIAIVSELFRLNKMTDEEICCRLLKEYGLKMVILTKGTDGSFVFSSDETSFMPTPQVSVIDTVGAGDCFTATFIAAYLQGKSIRIAHELAVRASAYTCTRQGAMQELPDKIKKLVLM